jgi:hypothetical protein
MRRHDLVHRKVQTRVDRTVAQVDLIEAVVLKNIYELRMLMANYERTDVRIGEIVDAHAQHREHVRVSDEASPLGSSSVA